MRKKFRINFADKKGFTLGRIITVPNWVCEYHIKSAFQYGELSVSNVMEIEID